MKNYIQLIFLVVSINLSAQTSTFYGDYDVNKNINANGTIKRKVDVSDKINQTINTIDYEQLAAANAQKEANKLNSTKYSNELLRQRALEIANDPNKAFDYGRDFFFMKKGAQAKILGYRKTFHKQRELYGNLFTKIHQSNYRNQSEDGIITEIELHGCFKLSGLNKKNPSIKETWERFRNGAEEYAKIDDWIVGEVTKDGSDLFIHNKDINTATVFSLKGFKGTVSYEDNHEYVIKDNYTADFDGGVCEAGARFKGDKDEVTFEQLEGRRYYFRTLIENIISSALMDGK
ncbi:MAG: hypothetical protein CMB82_11315 [Flammeovirgaceae bacterium]|nr:hypothetical protein [Flammeovirgaceae bacterium]|tara:strand:+ start:2703 stop:3572 length:870 start_codon:yes stop_codon:yes gene_type:complete